MYLLQNSKGIELRLEQQYIKKYSIHRRKQTKTDFLEILTDRHIGKDILLNNDNISIIKKEDQTQMKVQQVMRIQC